MGYVVVEVETTDPVSHDPTASSSTGCPKVSGPVPPKGPRAEVAVRNTFEITSSSVVAAPKAKAGASSSSKEPAPKAKAKTKRLPCGSPKRSAKAVPTSSVEPPPKAVAPAVEPSPKAESKSVERSSVAVPQAEPSLVVVPKVEAGPPKGKAIPIAVSLSAPATVLAPSPATGPILSKATGVTGGGICSSGFQWICAGFLTWTVWKRVVGRGIVDRRWQIG